MIFALLMRAPLLSLLLVLPAPIATDTGGIVSGQIRLTADGAARPDASNAVVWLEGVHREEGAAPAPAASREPQMRSDQKRFTPRVVVVRRNDSVNFPNVDPIYHNVFSVSGANRFDLGLYRSGASKKKDFAAPGLVRVYCNIHPQMVGFVMVVDSDFAAVTGPDGKFRLEGVPPGNWTLKVWQEEAQAEGSFPVTVRPRQETAVPVSLDVSSFKPAPHKNKYGRDYPPQAATDDERY
jgi:plastocyanin